MKANPAQLLAHHRSEAERCALSGLAYRADYHRWKASMLANVAPEPPAKAEGSPSPRFSPSAARLADRWNREANLRRDAGLYREAREARQVADRWAVAACNAEAFA